MLCQNEDHGDDAPESVAWIRLIALLDQPGYMGYEVCAPHLMDYVQGIFIDQPDNDIRLAFTVEPTP